MPCCHRGEEFGSTSPTLAAHQEVGGSVGWEYPAPLRWELAERRPGTPAVL